MYNEFMQEQKMSTEGKVAAPVLALWKKKAEGNKAEALKKEEEAADAKEEKEEEKDKEDEDARGDDEY
jgi:hypothetical protein